MHSTTHALPTPIPPLKSEKRRRLRQLRERARTTHTTHAVTSHLKCKVDTQSATLTMFISKTAQLICPSRAVTSVCVLSVVVASPYTSKPTRPVCHSYMLCHRLRDSALSSQKPRLRTPSFPPLLLALLAMKTIGSHVMARRITWGALSLEARGSRAGRAMLRSVAVVVRRRAV